MSDDKTNIVAFQPRPRAVPALKSVEICLDDETCDLEMTLHDDAGNVVATLAYSLTSTSEGFDLDLLREAWARWRGESAVAS